MRVTKAPLLLLTVVAAACSGDPEQPRDPNGGKRDALTGCEAIAFDPPENGIQLQMPLTVPAGSEAEYCQLVRIDETLYVNWSEGLYTNGSHHGLIHRTTYKGTLPTQTVTGQALENPDQPHPCLTPSALWQVDGVIAGGESVAGARDVNGLAKGVLPEDVAYKVEAGDVLLVNFHMINTTGEVLDSCYKANLHSVPTEQVTREAGTLFYYNPTITLPANGTSRARMACEVTQNITVPNVVSHMHSRGDGYSAKLWDRIPIDPGAVSLRDLYVTSEWDEPVPTRFEPPLELSAGQWIDYECRYTNGEARDVSQGFASTDEMCMFIGAYYPKNRALELCSGKRLIFGNGTRTGKEVVDCVKELSAPSLRGSFDNPDRYATQQCFTGSCPAVAEQLSAYMTCLQGQGAFNGGQQLGALCIPQADALTAAQCQ
jgi:hypothetical protein